MSKKKASRKGGRPSKFDAVDRQQVEFLAKRGFTDAELAEFFKVTEQTWNNWKSAHPEFFESLKDWKAEADRKVERSLYERAKGYSHAEDKIFNANGKPLVVPTTKHYPPDTTAAIFWLKNRMKDEWRDTQHINHSGSVQTADDAELRAELARKLEAHGLSVADLLGK